MKQVILKIILLYFSLAILYTVEAHNPGLSFSDLRIENDQLQAKITFSRIDIEHIIPIDLNNDKMITSNELSSALPKLYKFANELLQIENYNSEVSPSNISIKLIEQDGLLFRFNLPFISSTSQAVKFPIIKNLASGHRQYLTVWNNDGKILKQSILNAGSDLIVIDKKPVNGLSSFLTYFNEGVWHIWIGYDHILFLLTLILPVVLVRQKKSRHSIDRVQPSITNILKIVSAFTIAHSITLAFAIFEVVNVPSRMVESVIAFSVLVAALNNLYPIFNSSRVMLAFIFGLVHGLGFANVLIDLGLPNVSLLSALLGFNVGVEVGQLAIVLLFLPVAFLVRESHINKIWVLQGGSWTAALIACVWMAERVFDYKITGL